jgi:hypothetical protein
VCLISLVVDRSTGDLAYLINDTPTPRASFSMFAGQGFETLPSANLGQLDAVRLEAQIASRPIQAIHQPGLDLAVRYQDRRAGGQLLLPASESVPPVRRWSP